MRCVSCHRSPAHESLPIPLLALAHRYSRAGGGAGVGVFLRAGKVNRLPADKIARLESLFESGVTIRRAAREVDCHRDTVMRQRRRWAAKRLQLAYDVLWDGDGEECDRINANLPDNHVKNMLDCWLDDQSGCEPKSRFYYGEASQPTKAPTGQNENQ